MKQKWTWRDMKRFTLPADLVAGCRCKTETCYPFCVIFSLFFLRQVGTKDAFSYSAYCLACVSCCQFTREEFLDFHCAAFFRRLRRTGSLRYRICLRYVDKVVPYFLHSDQYFYLLFVQTNDNLPEKVSSPISELK